MDTQTLYDLTFPLAVPFWALMIFAPRWSVTRRIASSPLIAVPPLIVFVLLLVPQFPEYWAVMTSPSLPALTELFGTDAGSAAIWAQFIGFDLFVGRWIYLDARARGVHALISGPVLALTIFVSPLGLLAHLALRSVPGIRTVAAPDQQALAGGAASMSWEAVLGQVGSAPLPVVALVMALVMTMDTTVAVGFLVPSSDAIVLLAASAVGLGGAPAVALGSVAGCLAGWSLSFLLGRRFGPALRDGAFGRLVGPRRWDAAAGMLAGRSGRALLVLQFLPVLNAVVPAVAGALGMPYRRFAGLAAAGILGWVAVFAGLGAFVGTGVSPTTVVLAVLATTVALAAVSALRSVLAGTGALR